jgi:hypothetical protein
MYLFGQLIFPDGIRVVFGVMEIDLHSILLADDNLRPYRRLFERRCSARILTSSLRLAFNISQDMDARINQTESGDRCVSGCEANVMQPERF